MSKNKALPSMESFKKFPKLYCISEQTEYRDRMHDAIEGYEIISKREIEVKKVETGGLIRSTSETERSGELFKKISRGWC